MKAIRFINDFNRGNYERRISEKTQKSKSIAYNNDCFSGSLCSRYHDDYC